MKNTEAMIEKLERSAASERAIGNHEAASTFDAKAKRLRLKFNLPAPVAAPHAEENHIQQRRIAVEQYWESLKPETEVVIRVLEPGMRQTVDRVTSMEVALPLLKNQSALFVRLANGSNEFVFRPQEAPPPKEKSSVWFL
jgi:hypothetical protein